MGDSFTSLQPHAFERCSLSWGTALTKALAEVIATGGKALHRSLQSKGSKDPIQVVFAVFRQGENGSVIIIVGSRHQIGGKRGQKIRIYIILLRLFLELYRTHDPLLLASGIKSALSHGYDVACRRLA